MNLLDMAVISLPTSIVILTVIGFYKLFIKKKNITAFYTPFDEITGQTPIAFHEEQHVAEEDEGETDSKDGYNKGIKRHP